MRAWARKPFNYNGEELQRGQVFEMVGARNDEKLLGLDYCQEVNKKVKVLDCNCGYSFVGQDCYNYHLASEKHPKEPVLVSS